MLNNSNFKAHIKLSNTYKFDEIENALFNQIKSFCTIQNLEQSKNENYDVVIEIIDSSMDSIIYKSSFKKDSSGVLKKFDDEENKKAIAKAVEDFKTTARIDLKNYGGKSNQVAFLSPKPKGTFDFPKWYKNEKGTGCVFHSNEQSVDFSVKCIKDGILELILRGKDWRDKKNFRVPMKIDFTNLTINGEIVLNDKKTVWHDMPLKWNKKVSDGEILKIHVEWQPYDENNSNEASVKVKIKTTKKHLILNKTSSMLNQCL